MKRGLAFSCMCTLASYGENVLKDALWISGVSVHHWGIIKNLPSLWCYETTVSEQWPFYKFHWLWVIYLYISLPSEIHQLQWINTKGFGFLTNRNLTYLFRNNDLCTCGIQKCSRFLIYRIKFGIQRESQNKRKREGASKQKIKRPHLLFVPDYPQYHLMCTWKLHFIYLEMPFYVFIYFFFVYFPTG